MIGSIIRLYRQHIMHRVLLELCETNLADAAAASLVCFALVAY